MKKINTFLVSTLFIVSLNSMTIASASEPAVADDSQRQSIVLTEKERNLVLAEMRAFLEAVQHIIVGLSKDDLAVVAKAAKKVGMTEQTGMPASLKGKLPKGFKMLGMQTHKAFDQLALDAKDMEDKQQALAQLGALMANCTGCHSLYKLDVQK